MLDKKIFETKNIQELEEQEKNTKEAKIKGSEGRESERRNRYQEKENFDEKYIYDII